MQETRRSVRFRRCKNIARLPLVSVPTKSACSPRRFFGLYIQIRVLSADDSTVRRRWDGDKYKKLLLLLLLRTESREHRTKRRDRLRSRMLHARIRVRRSYICISGHTVSCVRSTGSIRSDFDSRSDKKRNWLNLSHPENVKSGTKKKDAIYLYKMLRERERKRENFLITYV